MDEATVGSLRSNATPPRSSDEEMEAIANGVSFDPAIRTPRVADLLVSYQGPYQDWVDKVKEVSYKNMEESSSLRILNAQVGRRVLLVTLHEASKTRRGSTVIFSWVNSYSACLCQCQSFKVEASAVRFLLHSL